MLKGRKKGRSMERERGGGGGGNIYMYRDGKSCGNIRRTK